MTVTIDGGDGRRGGLTAGLLAWLWPAPRHHRQTRVGWAFGSTMLGWLWPSAVHDETYGRRHGLMAALFGWAWPHSVDRGVRRWWHASWLWSWMWPGRVLGPDGEICPLAPWHPVLRPEAVPNENWRHKLRRHGPVMFMMFSATAIAAPTFMDNNNGALDGGRVNLFRSDGPATQDPPAGGDQGPTVGPGEGPGGGGPTTLQTGDLSGPQGPAGPDGAFTPGTGLDGGSDFGGGGGTGPGGGDPAPGDGGTTLVGPGFDPSGDLAPEQTLGGGGGGSGGGGGGAGGGGGGTGGGGDPTAPGGEDPFTPPGPPGPNFDPPGPLPPANPPADPIFPGPGPGTGAGGGGGGGGGGGPTTIPLEQFDPPGGGGGGVGGGDNPPRLQEPAAAVPEPATWAMMILGFGAVGYAIRRRRFAASLG